MSYPLLLSRCALAAAAVLLSACGGGDGGPSSAGIVSSKPASGAAGVDRGVQPEITFAEAVDADAVRLTCAGQPVVAEVTGSGRDVRIVPAVPLLPLATCTVQVAGAPALRFTTKDGAWAVPEAVPTGTGHAQNPSIAVDAQGRAVAVWTHDEDLGEVTVRASRYTPGSGWSTPLSFGPGGTPQVVMDAKGNAIAIYGALRSGSWSVLARRGTPDGNWGPAEEIDAGSPAVDRARLAMNAAGDTVVTWMQEDPDAFYYNVWANRYVPGTGWRGAQQVERLNQPTLEPAVAVGPAGVATVVWLQSDGDVMKTRASQSGRSGDWSTPVLLDTGTRSTGEPRVAAGADGSFVAVWTQPGAFIEVWARRFQPGAGWQDPGRVDAAPSGTYQPDVAVNASGEAVAVWVQNGAADGDVWASRYVAGSGWAPPARVDSTPRNAGSPLVALDDAGNALVMWSQWEAAGPSVWSNRMSAAGGWQQARRVSNAAKEAGLPVLSMAANGSALGAWYEYESATGYQVLFDRFE